MHKTCTGIKKTKKNKVWASTQGWGSIDCKILVILFFMMPVQVLWRSCFGFFSFFDACACLVKVRITKPAQASKKQKKQTTRCTKPAQASKKPKKKQSLSIYSGLGVYRLQLFCFFWCLCRFLWRSCFVFFWFLWCLCMFCQSLPGLRNKKLAFHQRFRPFRCINHCKSQCFVLIFFQKPPPHGGPLSKKNEAVEKPAVGKNLPFPPGGKTNSGSVTHPRGFRRREPRPSFCPTLRKAPGVAFPGVFPPSFVHGKTTTKGWEKKRHFFEG